MNQLEKLEAMFRKISSDQKKVVTEEILLISDIAKLNELLFLLLLIPKKLHTRLDNKKIIILEEYKLAVIQAILNVLEKNQPTPEIKKVSIWQKIYVNVFSFLTPVLTGIGGFTGFKALLSLIPGIINPVMLAFSIGVGILECFLSINSDVIDLRKNLNLSSFPQKPLLPIFSKQLVLTTNIYHRLLSPQCVNELTGDQYIEYGKALKILKSDIQEKNSLMTQEYKESFLRKGIKKLVGGIEAVLFAGSGYFMAKCALGLCMAALLTTPVGWIICGAAMMFSLGSFYYLRRKTVYNIVDQVAGDPKELKKSQENFLGEDGVKKFDKEMDLIIANKQRQQTKVEKLKETVRGLLTNTYVPKAENKNLPMSKSLGSLSFFNRVKETDRLDKSLFCSTLTRRIRSVSM